MTSSDLAISVRGLSKEYVIAHEQKYTTLGEKMVARLKNPLRRPRTERFRALNDVSFDVKKGDVLGIIGRNGAGKSTLLKILSRITEPTSGEIKLYGRVASLLEVGTGFHPELTGRENIYLNGAILGMRRSEIKSQFDAIVAFAEVEKFLDTPVKRYSSGMYVRLAFAVAAHLNPEILIVDEVLSVGDAEFQKKCLGKMQEVSTGQGRTVLFVSHNMAAVRSLCARGLLLTRGEVLLDDNASAVVHRYMAIDASVGTGGSRAFGRPRGISPWITAARVVCDGFTGGSIALGAAMSIEVDFAADPPIQRPKLGFVITNEEGINLVCANNRYQLGGELLRPASRGRICCDIGSPPLMPGRYVVNLYLGDAGADTHVVAAALQIDVIDRDVWGLGRTPPRDAASMWWPTSFESEELPSDQPTEVANAAR